MRASHEYRVVWQREGHRPKSKLFQKRSSAERQLQLLGPTPWVAWGQGPDELTCCNGHQCPCGGLAVREQTEQLRARMPALLFVRMEARRVARWKAAAQ